MGSWISDFTTSFSLDLSFKRGWAFIDWTPLVPRKGFCEFFLEYEEGLELEGLPERVVSHEDGGGGTQGVAISMAGGVFVQ